MSICITFLCECFVVVSNDDDDDDKNANGVAKEALFCLSRGGVLSCIQPPTTTKNKANAKQTTNNTNNNSSGDIVNVDDARVNTSIS